MRNTLLISSLIPLLVGNVFALQAQEGAPLMQKIKPASSEYIPKEYSYLYGMPGFSDALLKMHFQLYVGYVKNTNLLQSKFKELEAQDQESSYEYGALKRRFGWEWDGMRLHELYFENLGGQEPLDKFDPLFQRILKDFGSYESWKKNFMSIGQIRGCNKKHSPLYFRGL